MPDSTPTTTTNIVISSPGLDSNSPDAGRLKLFLTNFAGEVLTAYRRASVTSGRHLERVIASGKAAEFPVLGRAKANYLAPGANLDDLRKANSQTSVKIMIDGLLTSDVLITDLDEAMNHYDLRSEYAYQIGEALAMARDGGLLAEIAKMAMVNKELLPGLGKGEVVSRAVAGGLTAETEALGKAVVEELLHIKTAMSNNYVPLEGRVCYMLPVVKNALIANRDTINKLYGGVGTIVDGDVNKICGFDIVETPHLTAGGITDDKGAKPNGLIQGEGHIFPATYKTTAAFLCAHRYTVGTLTLKNFALEHARRANYQADQIIGKYAIGQGGLRPEAAFMGVITTA